MVTERVARRIREARALRDVDPSETLEMGFSAARFGRRLGEAAERARS